MPTIVLDTHFKVLMVSDTWQELTTLDSTKATGADLFDLIGAPERTATSEANKGRLYGALKRVKNRRCAETVNLIHICWSNSRCHTAEDWQVLISPALDHLGRVQTLLCSFDTTPAFTQASDPPHEIELNSISLISHCEKELTTNLATVDRESDLKEAFAYPLQEALQAHSVSIYVQTPGTRGLKLVARACTGRPGPFSGHFLDQHSESPAFEALAVEHPIVIANPTEAKNYSAELAALAHYGQARSWIYLPLIDHNEGVGVLELSFDHSIHPDLTQGIGLDHLIRVLSATLRRLRRHTATACASTEQLTSVLQQDIMPHLPTIDHLHLEALYSAGGSVTDIGGDWYDVFESPHGHIVSVIGDVAGRGLREGITGMNAARFIRGAVAGGLAEPHIILEQLNRFIAHNEPETIMSAVVVVAKPLPGLAHTWQVSWSNAGHLPPLLLGHIGRIRLLARPPDPILGALDHVPRNVHYTTVTHQDTMVLFTAGLIDRPRLSIDCNLQELLSTARRFHQHDAEDAMTWVSGYMPETRRDDVAIVTVRYRKNCSAATTPGALGHGDEVALPDTVAVVGDGAVSDGAVGDALVLGAVADVGEGTNSSCK